MDLGLCGSTAARSEGLDQAVVQREPLGVAVPVGHRLAAAEAVWLKELAGESHYLPRDDFAPEWNALVVARCQAAGFDPRRHPASTDGTGAALELVRAGECVALGLLSTPCPDGVVVQPLRDDVPPYEWVVRWREPGTQRTREVVEALSSDTSGSPSL
ncbi:LysR substrate-binding domain-containing protein [Kribbella deserti]|uniref:LysR substrate-binding domain-containing protein n=1 Tax=Kribbella deserti TaxID=1926257 RepID=A0ABV6QTT8_9ACTN